MGDSQQINDLFIAKLEKYYTDRELHDYFSKFGRVSRVLVKEGNAGQNYAFVNFFESRCAIAASASKSHPFGNALVRLNTKQNHNENTNAKSNVNEGRIRPITNFKKQEMQPWTCPDPGCKTSNKEDKCKKCGLMKTQTVLFQKEPLDTGRKGNTNPHEKWLVTTYVENMATIYAQDTHNYEFLKKISEEIETFACRNSGLCSSPEKNKIYVGKYPDGNWYRCRLVDARKDNKSTVQYIDYGDFATILNCQMRELPKKLQDIPPLCVRYRLDGIKPIVGLEDKVLNDGRKWLTTEGANGMYAFIQKNPNYDAYIAECWIPKEDGVWINLSSEVLKRNYVAVCGREPRTQQPEALKNLKTSMMWGVEASQTNNVTYNKLEISEKLEVSDFKPETNAYDLFKEIENEPITSSTPNDIFSPFNGSTGLSCDDLNSVAVSLSSAISTYNQQNSVMQEPSTDQFQISNRSTPNFMRESESPFSDFQNLNTGFQSLDTVVNGISENTKMKQSSGLGSSDAFGDIDNYKYAETSNGFKNINSVGHVKQETPSPQQNETVGLLQMEIDTLHSVNQKLIEETKVLNDAQRTLKEENQLLKEYSSKSTLSTVLSELQPLIVQSNQASILFNDEDEDPLFEGVDLIKKFVPPNSEMYEMSLVTVEDIASEFSDMQKKFDTIPAEKLEDVVKDRNNLRKELNVLITHFLKESDHGNYEDKLREMSLIINRLDKDINPNVNSEESCNMDNFNLMLQQYKSWKNKNKEDFFEYQLKIKECSKLLSEYFQDVSHFVLGVYEAPPPVDFNQLVQDYKSALLSKINWVTKINSDQEVILKLKHAIYETLSAQRKEVVYIVATREKYKNLQVELKKWVNKSPDVEELYTIKKDLKSLRSQLRHALVAFYDAEEDDDKDEVKIKELREKRDTITEQIKEYQEKEDELLSELSGICKNHFPELKVLHPDIKWKFDEDSFDQEVKPNSPGETRTHDICNQLEQLRCSLENVNVDTF